MDPVYGFEAVNVEAHRRNPSSHLHWLRNILQTRRQFPVFGTGTFDLVPCANPSILAYVRSPQPESGQAGRSRRTGRVRRGARGHDGGADNPVLCVHNLSRFAQPAELDLARWANRSPVELLGRIPFPPVGTGMYSVTLGPYGFYWFELIGEHGGVADAPGPGPGSGAGPRPGTGGAT
jgi:maltose alpha-D-glucosyltransferase/alpha-amylase